MTDQLNIYINDQALCLTAPCSLQDALTYWAQTPCGSVTRSTTYAIALNQHFVARSQYANTPLKANDKIELLTPMSGG